VTLDSDFVLLSPVNAGSGRIRAVVATMVDDFDSVLRSHHRFGMSIVPVSPARQRTCSTFQISA
jgi:hypothetical protein